VTVHVADPKRLASLVLALVLVAAVVLILYALAGSTEPVDVGRS
jgi:hypothetical protein